MEHKVIVNSVVEGKDVLIKIILDVLSYKILDNAKQTAHNSPVCVTPPCGG
jgi:hypothetical protein